MPIERKKTLNVFKDAREAWGSYDDYPVGQPGTDPMPHLSRNRCPQPFFLVSEADQVLIQMSGHGEIQFRDSEPAQLALEPGDTVYIPACVPSRIVPHDENIQIRLKVEPAVREAVAWYCECGAVVHVDRDRRRCAQAGGVSRGGARVQREHACVPELRAGSSGRRARRHRVGRHRCGAALSFTPPPARTTHRRRTAYARAAARRACSSRR